MSITYEWRGAFDSAEVRSLHAQGFGAANRAEDWWRRVNVHSLGWVCARLDGALVGFVNVAWDGATHAFLLDTVVAPAVQRRRVGSGLVVSAVDGARSRGCAWLHVDFSEDLRRFYLDACGFAPTAAGLIAL